MNKLFIVIGVVVIGLIVWHPWQRNPAPPVIHKPVQVTAKNGVCGFNSPPCIRMTTPDKIYEFNDFRFKPNGCIDFVTLPGRVAGSYCGKFELIWIGPTGATYEQ